jgi:hypothetical protein
MKDEQEKNDQEVSSNGQPVIQEEWRSPDFAEQEELQAKIDRTIRENPELLAEIRANPIRVERY